MKACPGSNKNHTGTDIAATVFVGFSENNYLGVRRVTEQHLLLITQDQTFILEVFLEVSRGAE